MTLNIASLKIKQRLKYRKSNRACSFQLFLDDARMKNFTSCFKGRPDFLFHFDRFCLHPALYLCFCFLD